jgi:hypothetical protein
MGYPLNRTLGHSLSALGNAHVKVATLQEQFGEQLNSMFLTRLELSLSEVAQYYVLRKKLKSRRFGRSSILRHKLTRFPGSPMMRPYRRFRNRRRRRPKGWLRKKRSPVLANDCMSIKLLLSLLNIVLVKRSQQKYRLKWNGFKMGKWTSSKTLADYWTWN